MRRDVMFDAATTVHSGFLWAIVLAWTAFLTHKIGFSVLPIVTLPLFSSWALGERRGYDKAVRDLREALEKRRP